MGQVSNIYETGRSKVAILIVCLIFPVFIFAQEKGEQSENRLFHIERSKNKNMVCYDVNLIEGKLDTKKPLDIYWVNREEAPGRVNGLSAVEKKFAYGYKLISQGEDSSSFTLTAYPGRTISVQRIEEKYVCVLIIDDQPAILKKLYVQAKPGNSLTVEYVELFGIALDSKKPVSEKVFKK